MDISLLKDIKINVWYRGSKILTINKIEQNTIHFSNNDKITINNNDIYLNNSLLCNVPNITENELLDIYKWHLLKKGYKFLD